MRQIKKKQGKSQPPEDVRGKGLALLTAYVTASYVLFLFGMSPNKSEDETYLEQVYILPVVGTHVAQLEVAGLQLYNLQGVLAVCNLLG